MKRRAHYPGIDFLRIFAATLVLLNHFSSYSSTTASIADGREVAFKFLSVFDGLGAVGVEIFFVISGFVIAMSASGEGGVSHALRFARDRGTRILPALWISALIAFLVRVLYGEDVFTLLMDLARSAMLSPKGPYIDGVVWSLVVEAVFYLLVLVSILWKFRISLYALGKLLGLSSSIYLLVLCVLYLAPPSAHADDLISILSRFPFKVFLLQHGVFFAAGIMLFVSHGDGSEQEWPATPNVALFLLFCAMGVVEIVISVHRPYEYRLLAALIWISSVVFLYLTIRARNVIDQNYASVLRWLGSLSYPLYLNHYSVGMIASYSLFYIGFPMPYVLVLSILWVLSLSMLVMWLEKRIQTAIKAKFPSSFAQVVTGTVASAGRRAEATTV